MHADNEIGRIMGFGMRTLIAALIAPVLLCAAPRLAAQAGVPRLEHSECPFERGEWARDIKLECSWLVVPEMRDRPTGRTVRLAVAVVRAKNPITTPLVMLHGGPGLSGLRIFFPSAAVSDVARTRVMVIYDQRGAGDSEPKLCPDYGAVEDSARRLRTFAEREKLWDVRDRACVASLRAQGIEPAAYNTLASARDLIDLRKALGYTLWDVFSTSYGARLAQEAIRQDPGGIRSVVMGSPVTLGPARHAEVALSVQRAIESVWKECAAQVPCTAAFPNVRDDFYALHDELSRNPLPVLVRRDNRVGDTVWIDGKGLVSAIRTEFLGRPGRLARLPLLVNELRRGDKARAAELLAGFEANTGATNQQVLIHLVNCYDIYGRAFLAARDSANALAHPAFRNVQMDDCPIWQTRFADQSEHKPVRSDIPTLILTGRFDDRTPTEQARRIGATLSHAYQYEFPNEGHDAPPVGCHLSILMQFFENPFRAPDGSCIAAIPPITFVTTWGDRK
jgi:pimeloyl-ACP methyl ester carboxylesterase